jgi:hypothetical protein
MPTANAVPVLLMETQFANDLKPLRTRAVTSSCLCKQREGAGFPSQVESPQDGVDGPVHTFYVYKAHHGTGTAAPSSRQTRPISN